MVGVGFRGRVATSVGGRLPGGSGLARRARRTGGGIGEGLWRAATGRLLGVVLGVCLVRLVRLAALGAACVCATGRLVGAGVGPAINGIVQP
jgi:hypothetical protein